MRYYPEGERYQPEEPATRKRESEFKNLYVFFCYARKQQYTIKQAEYELRQINLVTRHILRKK